MAREAQVTEQQFNVAAGQLQKEGRSVTARAVRDILGIGSMATILKYLQAWKASQPSTEASAQARLQIDTGIATAITAHVNSAIAVAVAERDGQIVSLQSDLQATADESERLAAAVSEGEKVIQELRDCLAASASKIENLNVAHEKAQRDLVVMSDERSRLTTEVAVARAQQQAAESNLIEMKLQLKSAQDMAREAQNEAASLRGALDALKSELIKQQAQHKNEEEGVVIQSR